MRIKRIFFGRAKKLHKSRILLVGETLGDGKKIHRHRFAVTIQKKNSPSPLGGDDTEKKITVTASR